MYEIFKNGGKTDLAFMIPDGYQSGKSVILETN